MIIEAKLAELGIDLPEAPAPVAAYQPLIRAGNLIFTSGQLPFRNGEISYAGKLGAELSNEDGYQAARQAALNAIAHIKSATGDLDKVKTIIRIEGYVHCAEGFRDHPQVLNGASDLIAEIFGDRGIHTRLALGINEMPLNAAVQLAMIVEAAD